MTIEILTGLLVIVTAVYAVLTHRIARANESAVAAMKSQVLATTRPYVHFDIRMLRASLEAVLINRGVTAAHRVEIKCDPPLYSFGTGTQEAAKLIRDEIPLLIPGREIVEFLGFWDKFQQGGQLGEFRVSVLYFDSAGTKFEEKSEISVSRFVGLPYIAQPDTSAGILRIASACEKLAAK